MIVFFSYTQGNNESFRPFSFCMIFFQDATIFFQLQIQQNKSAPGPECGLMTFSSE